MSVNLSVFGSPNFNFPSPIAISPPFDKCLLNSVVLGLSFIFNSFGNFFDTFTFPSPSIILYSYSFLGFPFLLYKIFPFLSVFIF